MHILAKGRIVASGGPELADVLERDGYAAFVPEVGGAPDAARPLRASPAPRIRSPSPAGVMS